MVGVYDPANAHHLRPWLVRTLEPICDAEPGALADYVLALLKHEVPESQLREEISKQLDEFLEKECKSFVNTLFTAIRTSSYLPYTDGTPAASSSSGIPIPIDDTESTTRKRAISDDYGEGRPAAKGPRLSTEGQFSRYNGQPGGSTGSWNRPGWRDNHAEPGFQRGTNGQMNGRGGYQPPMLPRGVCRDYFNHGYCMRGASCKFSHGEDAMVPDMFPMQAFGMPFMPMFPPGPGFGPESGYDPHQSQMDMRPVPNGMGRPNQNRAPNVLPRMGNSSNVPHNRASGELPVIQDLTPASNERPRQPHPHPYPHDPAATQPPFPQNVNMPFGRPHNMAPSPPISGMNNGSIPMDVDGDPIISRRPPTRGRGGARPPVGRPVDRGTFNDEAANFRPEKRKGLTLVVEKIPTDKLSLESVNNWFKRFGTVTNVAIDAQSGKALVSFSTNEEAHAAWKSEDAVFNNRFVKVFWHRPMEGHGQKGSKMLAASAPVVAHLATSEASTGGSSSPVSGTPAPPNLTSPKKVSSSGTKLAAKQQLLEKQISEQKSLMDSLSTAAPEEKKDILARLRKLNEDMKQSAESKPTADKPEPDQQMREQLDSELELHAVSNGGEDQSDNTKALKAKLEKLKAEAASLGLSDTPSSGPANRGFSGGYRGRGRSRGYFRGSYRGGPPRQSMKLDNRPKKLLVRSVEPEQLDALRDWFGPVEDLQRAEDGEVVVSFATRGSAEQGLAKGTDIPSIGNVEISWYTGGKPHPSSSTAVASSTESKPMDTEDYSRDDATENHKHDEEETIVNGWGGDEMI